MNNITSTILQLSNRISNYFSFAIRFITKLSQKILHNKRNDKTNTDSQDNNLEPLESTELTQFHNIIYNIKLLGHEDPRFQSVTIEAYNLINQYGEQSHFFNEIINSTADKTDFSTEIIRHVISLKQQGTRDSEIIKIIREKYIDRKSISSDKITRIPRQTPCNVEKPEYLESTTNRGSEVLKAKSKIALKHKALHYANIIGGSIIEDFNNSGNSSLSDFIRHRYASIAGKGNNILTNDDFEPQIKHKNIYKKHKNKPNFQNVPTRITTPRFQSNDSKTDTFLRILDKLTYSKLPRYELPSIPSNTIIFQREYVKTNPLEVFNDLVLTEYSPEYLTDKRFAVLYQVIIFISECLDKGMSENETVDALSKLRIIRKADLNVLRQRAIKLQGLSHTEKELIHDCEITNKTDIVNLYIDLIHHYRKSQQPTNLYNYLTAILLKNRKNSPVAWNLFKYIYLNPNKIRNHKVLPVADNLQNWRPGSEFRNLCGTKHQYYSFRNSFTRLRYEYDNNLNMTRYNFNRDKLSTDLMNEQDVKKHLPNRLDSKGRFCSLIQINQHDAVLFDNHDKIIAGRYIYLLIPIRALTTEDLYDLLLIVDKQKKKHESA